MTSLIARLEAATEPSREFDEEIAVVLLGLHAVTNTDFYADKDNNVIFRGDISPYTSSIDAAVALAKRVLPGWGYFLRSDKEGHNCGMVYPDAFRVTPGCGSAANAATSMCIAILKAKETSHE